MANQTNLDIIFNAKDNLSKTVGSMKKNLKSMEPQLKQVTAIGTVAFAAIGAGIISATNKASDFEEASNKFSVVFQDVSKEAQAMADTLNKSYGLSILKSKEMLSGTGDILTGFGFTGKAALDLSSKVSTLAVDLASFTNAQGGAEAVSSALTKALLGERESLKTYGITIQEADVQAELLAMGMDNLTGEALRQAKAEATLKIALRQSKNAVGDYARSQGTLVQTKIELRKTFEDLTIVIGKQFIPIINDVLAKVTPLITKVQEWVKENPELAKRLIIAGLAVAGLTAAIGALGLVMLAISPMAIVVGLALGAIVAIGVLIARNWESLIEKWELLKATLDETGILDGFIALWEYLVVVFREQLLPELQKLWEMIEPILIPALKILGILIGATIVGAIGLLMVAVVAITKTLAVLLGWFNAIHKFIKDFFLETIQNVKSGFEVVAESIEKAYNWIVKLIQKIRELARETGGKIKSFFGFGGKVDDAIIAPDGKVITTNPEDYIIATQDPNSLLGATGGSNVVVNVSGNFLSEDAAEQMGDLILGRLQTEFRGAGQ